MKQNSTSMTRADGAGWLLGLAGCALAACTMGADPDPRTLGGSQQTTAERAQNDAPVVAVAEFATADVGSAPLDESRLPSAAPPKARPLVIAIGQNVGHVVDQQLKESFLGAGNDESGRWNALVDRDVIDALVLAQADFGVIGGQLSAREQHAGLRQAQLGIELFALAVAPDSPLLSLSPVQVRRIFTGQVTEWNQLGLPGGAIVPVVPADAAVAERAARTLIPGDDFVSTVTRVASLRHVADQTLRFPGAIGIVRVTDAAPENGIKLLQIDWTTPSFETFNYGTYPYAVPFQLITSGTPIGEAQRFLDFARSDAGRELLGRTLRTR